MNFTSHYSHAHSRQSLNLRALHLEIQQLRVYQLIKISLTTNVTILDILTEIHTNRSDK